MTEPNAKEEDPRMPESLKGLQEEAKRKWTTEVENSAPLRSDASSKTKLSMKYLNQLFSNSKSDLSVYVGLDDEADESEKDTGKCKQKEKGCDVEPDDECTECLGTTQSSRRGLARQASERHRTKAEPDSSRTDTTVVRTRREIGRTASARKVASTRSGSARDLLKRDLARPLPQRSMSSRDVATGESSSKEGRPLTSGRRSSPSPRRSLDLVGSTSSLNVGGTSLSKRRISNRKSLDLGGSASSLNVGGTSSAKRSSSKSRSLDLVDNASSLKLDGRSSSLHKRKGNSKGPRKARGSRNSPQRKISSGDPKKRVGTSSEAGKSRGDKADSCHTDGNHAVLGLLKKEGSSRRPRAGGPQGGGQSPPRKGGSRSSSREPRKRNITSRKVETSTFDAADSLHHFARQKRNHSQRLHRALSTRALDEAEKKTRKGIVRRNKSADYLGLQDLQEATKVNATWTATTRETSKACRPSLMDQRLRSAFQRIIAKKDALDAAAIEHGPSQITCTNASETSATDSLPNADGGKEEPSSESIETSKGAAGTTAEISLKEDAADSDASQTSALPPKVEVTPSICRAEVDALNDDDTVILTPEEMKYWRCKCGEPNENIFKFCGMCREAKNWSCVICKFEHNKCRFLYCGSCSSPKVVLSTSSSCPKILPSPDSLGSVGSTAA